MQGQFAPVPFTEVYMRHLATLAAFEAPRPVAPPLNTYEPVAEAVVAPDVGPDTGPVAGPQAVAAEAAAPVADHGAYNPPEYWPEELRKHKRAPYASLAEETSLFEGFEPEAEEVPPAPEQMRQAPRTAPVQPVPLQAVPSPFVPQQPVPPQPAVQQPAPQQPTPQQATPQHAAPQPERRQPYAPYVPPLRAQVPPAAAAAYTPPPPFTAYAPPQPYAAAPRASHQAHQSGRQSGHQSANQSAEEMKVAWQGVEYPVACWDVQGFELAVEIPRVLAPGQGRRGEFTLLIGTGGTRIEMRVQARRIGAEPGAALRYEFIDMAPAQAGVLQRIIETSVVNQAMDLSRQWHAPQPQQPQPQPQSAQAQPQDWDQYQPQNQAFNQTPSQSFNHTQSPPLTRSQTAVQTQTATQTATLAQTEPKTKARSLGIVSMVKLALAAVILAVAGLLTWSSFATVQARYAAVTVAATSLSVPVAGRLNAMTVQPGQELRTGEVLGFVHPADQDAQVAALIEHRRALEVELAALRSQRGAMAQGADAAAIPAPAATGVDGAARAQLEQVLALAERRLALERDQLAAMVASDLPAASLQRDRAQQEALVAEAERAVLEVQTQLSTTAPAPITMMQGGLGDSAPMGASDLRIASLSDEIDALYVRESRLQNGEAILSPCDCVVQQIDRRAGEWIEPGEQLALLRGSETPVIHALLASDAAREIDMGDRARIDLADGSRIEGRVARINYEAQWPGYTGLQADVFAANRYARVEIQPDMPLTAPVGTRAEVQLQTNEWVARTTAALYRMVGL
ncbi:HlyD family secretion protein [Pararhodobacter oceanensis]|uniref:HlyD family secretion protein n=1 Tax=Pararhodobacter oceanensis TaxID=2172121 RepID=UPI003A90A3C3